jgi:serine/threonine-protein kinase RsbW
MTDQAGDSGERALPFDELRVAIDLAIPSDVRYIERVVDLVRRQCAELAYSPRHCALNVPVALAEALANAILYGNGESPGARVEVHARVDRESLVVEISDEGRGFDLDACTQDPTTAEHLEDEGGRGLFLMRRLMDRVERFAGGDQVSTRANVVRLTLRRTT